MRYKKWFACLTLVCLLAVAMVSSVGCGSSDTSTNAAVLARNPCAYAHHGIWRKAKIVAKVGGVYVSFKKWVYDPMKAGDFKKGAPGRTKTMAKAGATLLVDAALLHSLRDDVVEDKTFCHILTPYNKLVATLRVIGNKLKSGTATATDVNGLKGMVNSIKHAK